ncbi:MAG: 3-dehydroquinate synthase [Cyanobacteria bacterium]|nr:3-dehydroquinate synthase [Cyanobacteriota bacterium]
MKSVEIKTLNRKYKVLIENNITGGIIYHIKENFSDFNNLIVILNDKLYGIYGEKISKILCTNFKLNTIIINDGEKYKNIDTLKYIYQQLLKMNIHRNDVILSFGGGVTGDIAGFAAATFNRGIKLIQYPTTIIAQVDSSIGGKTGINFKNTKNIIGCFYQPHLIVTDPELLKTLDENEIINGFGEIIKYGLVFDYQIIDDILNISGNYKNDENRLFKIIENADFENIIYKCIKIKAEIVEKDEFDLNERQFLNFGHTIGHALEKTIGFDNINHGQAVSLGILCALDMSENLGYLKRDFKKDILALYDILKLPKFISKISIKKIMKSLKYDKKFTSSKNRFILLKGLNKPVIYNNLNENIVKNSIINNMLT